MNNVVPLVLVMNDAYWLPYVLKSIDGWFNKIVIYDAGSEDGTIDICRWFRDTSTSEVLLEEFPFVPPKAQLAYRNAAIADAQTDYYMLVDGDEIWAERSLVELSNYFEDYRASNKPYGLVNRTEVNADLNTAYSDGTWLQHHRVYHRTCTWRGTHPGERATIPQKPKTEHRFPDDVVVYHFHNTLRSPLEDKVPSRVKRKSQSSYHRGGISNIDILERLPILQNRVEKFPVSPELERLWET
ncbi:MAG: glycosyltransferase [Candidatus Thorarchaeota archaeon]|jgi:glycosyltransferase involved in cell wall biosynthesis